MRKVFFFHIFLIISTLGICQSPLNLSFHHLTREDGLSNNNIFYIFHDSRGFLWLSSFNGLNRFDGMAVKTYTSNNSTLKGSHISNIIEDKTGNLWLGTEAGLQFYDRKKDEFRKIDDPNISDKNNAFPYEIDDKNRLWVVMFYKKTFGLYVYSSKTKRFTLVTTQIPEHLPTSSNSHFQPIKTIYCAAKNNFGIEKISIENEKAIKIEHFFDGKNNQKLLKNIKEYIFAENDSTIWITGNEYGLLKFNPLKNTFQHFNKFENLTITQLFKTIAFQNLLICGSDKGLFIFDKKSNKFRQHIQRSLYNANGLMSNWVETPYIDDAQNIFLSELGFGIDFTNLTATIAQQWLKLDETTKLSLPDNHITQIKQRGNQTWAKFQNSGTVLLNNEGKILQKFQEFTPLLNDSENRFWLTNGKYFLITNPEKNIHKKLIFKELSNKLNWQTSMLELSKKVFLVSSEKGLFLIDENKNTLEPIADFNKEKSVFNSPIFYDKTTNQIFISTNWWSEFYVLEQKNKAWKIKKKFTFPFQIFAIKAANAHSKIWLGTSSGLSLFNTQSLDYQLFTEKNGLPDNSVTDIVEEPNGDHWLVTNRGISFFDFQKKTYRNFTTKDGAYSNEYDWNCAFKLPDNRMVFGGTNGITVIKPSATKEYYVRPTIQITQLYANEKPIKKSTNIGETKTIELSPEENSFAMDLVGIEYGYPEKIRLQYQLKGYDKQWISAKNHATARYTNVSDGTYEFQAKATDEDGKNSSEIRHLMITVHAPFYRTTWFRILMVLGFIVLGYWFYRLRIGQLQADTRKKEEIKRIRAEAEINALRSQMNPHFIFNCLNTIDSYILLNKTEEASEFLQKFSKLIRRILENSRQEFVPIEQDIEALELYIKLEQERSHPKFQYEISIDKKIKENAYFIPSMLIQPFVENAILHGLRHKRDAVGELHLTMQIIDNQLVTKIIDNGIGREASMKINALKNLNKHSVGIKLTEERIEKLNEIYLNQAYLKVTDMEKGTVVEIGLPLLTHEKIR